MTEMIKVKEESKMREEKELIEVTDKIDITVEIDSQCLIEETQRIKAQGSREGMEKDQHLTVTSTTITTVVFMVVNVDSSIEMLQDVVMMETVKDFVAHSTMKSKILSATRQGSLF